ncbi:MAG TPA: PH domain-containing protein [Symbiobacteriaceae bacterium]|nr:PH domain-containing protein [Symbiobacteriaceae bacterium]
MTPKEQAIQASLKQLPGANIWFSKAEIKELPNILWEDELPERIIAGYYAKGNGILVATNKRLVFIDKGLMWGLRVEDFPYDKISTIEYNTGMLLGDLTIYTSGNRAKIEHVDKTQVREFGEYVRARITSAMAHKSAAAAPAASPPAPPAGGDVMAQLERLAQLRTQGLIDETEFKAAKARLLGL